MESEVPQTQQQPAKAKIARPALKRRHSESHLLSDYDDVFKPSSYAQFLHCASTRKDKRRMELSFEDYKKCLAKYKGIAKEREDGGFGFLPTQMMFGPSEQSQNLFENLIVRNKQTFQCVRTSEETSRFKMEKARFKKEPTEQIKQETVETNQSSQQKKHPEHATATNRKYDMGNMNIMKLLIKNQVREQDLPDGLSNANFRVLVQARLQRDIFFKQNRLLNLAIAFIDACYDRLLNECPYWVCLASKDRLPIWLEFDADTKVENAELFSKDYANLPFEVRYNFFKEMEYIQSLFTNWCFFNFMKSTSVKEKRVLERAFKKFPNDFDSFMSETITVCQFSIDIKYFYELRKYQMLNKPDCIELDDDDNHDDDNSKNDKADSGTQKVPVKAET